MSLTYADFCTQCGKRRTRHPSGLCCDCRRRFNQSFTPKKACRYCGKKRDDVADGLCPDCRQKVDGKDEHDRRSTAIDELKTNLFIIEERDRGTSFDAIANIIGMSRTAVYRRYRTLVPADSAEKAFAVIV